MAGNNNISIHARILVVDDDEAIRDALKLILEDDYDVVCVDSGFKAVEEVKNQVFDLVFLDVVMPEMDGIETLRRIKAHDKNLDIIMVSAINRAQEATDSIRHGAYDYITKPFDHKIILNRLEKVLLKRNLVKEVSFHRSQAASGSWRTKIISKAKNMSAVFDLIAKVAKTSSNVIITGESGTGKELVAHAIHRLSTRVNGPFVAVHCAALSSNLLESELFGHEKGAFTGAVSQRKGRFEMADGGTLFLDEISEIDAAVQVKLLRVLEERRFERGGGDHPV